jgi:hypothetical protein
MGKKIFVSYKYADKQIRQLDGHNPTTVRDYVDIFQEQIEKQGNHINKGEKDGENLSNFKESTIGSKLADKIFDSTVTVVFISKGMKENNLAEDDQWIPWEVSYSLKEQSREGQNSKTNAILAVVLPDENNNYDYFITDNACPVCKCRTLHTPILFEILKKNMFNIKKPQFSDCFNHSENNKPFLGDSSYIFSVKWEDFIQNIDANIEKSLEIWRKREEYEIRKNV